MARRLNDEQLTTIYRETLDDLYGYVSKRCGGDRALAEDIVQETWLRAVRSWCASGAPSRPIAWLTTVSHNLLLNEFRRKQPVAFESVDPDEVMRAMENGSPHDSREVAALVNNALARIPEDQSRLLEAFHFERIKVADLAALFRISEKAVEGRLRRAREKLRIELAAIIKANGDMT